MVSRKVLSVYSELSNLYVETKTYPKAERLLREVMANKQALGNNIHPFYLTLGKYYYHCGQLDSAKIYLEQCTGKSGAIGHESGGCLLSIPNSPIEKTMDPLCEVESTI